LLDVAGILLSLGEAGDTALDRVTGDLPEARAALQRTVDDWEGLAHQAFFRSYRRAMNGHPSHLADAAVADTLLTLLLAEKAISDVRVALAQHMPGVGAAMRRLIQVAQR
jgi:maltose alpha-D-glucosyltransferase/alpha-amylase